MKQKGNNIDDIKTYNCVKGLIILILLLFVGKITAQKAIKKTIITSAEKIIIEFDIIDQVEIFTSEFDSNITVISESENEFSPNFNVEEKNGIVFIKSKENSIEEKTFEVDKLCSIQPNYSSYQIRIPKNKNIEISFTEGNFYTNGFDGNLELKVEEGIVKIKDFKGSVNVHINIGNIYVLGINTAMINVKSNLGYVRSNLNITTTNNNKNQIVGVFEKDINSLYINAILANIHLKSSKN